MRILFTLVTVILTRAFAGEVVDLNALQKKMAELKACETALQAQIDIEKARLAREVSVKEMTDILTAFRHYVENEPTPYGYFANWERVKGDLKDSFVIFEKSVDRPGFYSLYFASPNGDLSYDGFGLATDPKGALYVGTNYEDIQIGAKYVSEDLYDDVLDARVESLSKLYSDAHPALAEKVLTTRRNELVEQISTFKENLRTAKKRSAQAEAAFHHKILKDGMPFPWLINLVKL